MKKWKWSMVVNDRVEHICPYKDMRWENQSPSGIQRRLISSIGERIHTFGWKFLMERVHIDSNTYLFSITLGMKNRPFFRPYQIDSTYCSKQSFQTSQNKGVIRCTYRSQRAIYTYIQEFMERKISYCSQVSVCGSSQV